MALCTSMRHLPAAKLEPFEQAGVALSLLRAAADAHPAVDASGAVRHCVCDVSMASYRKLQSEVPGVSSRL